MHNAKMLRKAAEYCVNNKIGCFRVSSRILPLKTHPQFGYDMAQLPEGKAIRRAFADCGAYAKKCNLRFSFHPDQFVLLSSTRIDVTRKSIKDLEYHAQVSEWIGADVINIHGGGSYGDKKAALRRFVKALKKISRSVRRRLTIENDDRVYTPADLLPLCEKTGMPLVYDVHHHRCHKDNLTVEQATKHALKTWNRKPLFHISSPKKGWRSRRPQYHHDYINIKDWPACWSGLDITVEVEAKAKELAVKRLYKQLLAKNIC
jgi:UV DNA damage endonuclease